MKTPVLVLLLVTLFVAVSADLLERRSYLSQHRRMAENDKNNDKNNNKNNNNNKNSAGGNPLWTSTEQCNCYEYLTDSFFRDQKYDFDLGFSNGHHERTYNVGYYHMSEFCCEFAAELVDPTCELTKEGWVNSEGEPPNAPKESLVCDLFAEEDVVYRSKLKQEARNACYCFYRDIGCGKEELGHGGYCDYPNSEVTLDDFRMANNSAHNMCNACLEKSGRYDFPNEYEGLPHQQCLGYCLLKRGDPNDVYAPTVSDKPCCLDEEGVGLRLQGYESDKIEQEIIFMPFAKLEERTYDYFFQSPVPNPIPTFDSREYDVSLRYDGLCTMFMSVERYGQGEEDPEPALFDISEFDIQCEPEDWDSLSVHMFDESDDGGIVFRNVTMDGVDLGAFGFAIQTDPGCTDTFVIADTPGVHGHNKTCITRPGGYGHISGFELKGIVELTGQFVGDDIGMELIVGCKQKEKEHDHCCCGEGHRDAGVLTKPW